MNELQLAYMRARHGYNGNTKLPIPVQKSEIADIRRKIVVFEAEIAALKHVVETLSTELRTAVYKYEHAPEPGLSTEPRRRPHTPEIVKAVCQFYHCHEADLLSDRHTQPVSRYRQIAMYLCARLTFLSLPAIGKKFNRDHTTILHARDKIAALRNTDEQLRADLMALELKLYPQGVA